MKPFVEIWKGYIAARLCTA